MDKDVVVNGATIECTGSRKKSFLVVPPSFMIEVGGQHSANIKQHKPIENILPFGICEIQPGKPPCIPVTPTPWEPGETTVDFGQEPTLEVKSKCKCSHGGIIEFVNSGQGNAFLSVDCQTTYSPLAEQAASRFNQLKYVDALEAQNAAEDAAEAGERKLRNQIAKTALETAKEASGYNDAGKALEAAKSGDWLGTLEHGALAIPLFGKVGKLPKLKELPDAVRALRGGVKKQVRKIKKPRKGIEDIDRGAQNKHYKGTNEYTPRPTGKRKTLRTAWIIPAAEADKLTLQAYKFGRVLKRYPDGSPETVVRQMVRPVGENGERLIKVRVSPDGQIRGYPAGPNRKKS